MGDVGRKVQYGSQVPE